MQQIVEYLTGYLDDESPGGMLGLYVTGSAAMGGLRPKSDIDFVLVTQQPLTQAERQRLVTLLLKTSQGVDEPVRPLELTSVAVSDVVPWTYPPMCDLLYGEWLRETLSRGSVPQRHISPDLTVMLGTLLRNSRQFEAPPPAT